MYKEITIDRNSLKVGDNFCTYYLGRGRGGHVVMYLKVDKINRKTIDCTENPGSYGSRTSWRFRKDDETRVWVLKEV